MNILVTGSTGFIGSYFIANNAKEHNIHRFSFLKDSLNTIDMTGIDVVIHLAAIVHQMKGLNDNNEYFHVNTDKTIQLAKKAKTAGVKHFIFMSSIKVYGDQLDAPFNEDSQCHPDDPYGKSKLKAEKLLMELNDDTFIISIIRTPVVYGEGVKANILNLVKLIDKLPILPFGNIKNKRTLVYIGNLTALIKTIIDKKKTGIFLAADPLSFSTTEFIKEISQALGKNIFLLYIPGFPTLLKILKPKIYNRLYNNLSINNQKTKDILEFKEPFSNRQGIENMVKWHKGLT